MQPLHVIFSQVISIKSGENKSSTDKINELIFSAFAETTDHPIDLAANIILPRNKDVILYHLRSDLEEEIEFDIEHLTYEIVNIAIDRSFRITSKEVKYDIIIMATSHKYICYEILADRTFVCCQEGDDKVKFLKGPYEVYIEQ